ncbi:Protein F26A10.2 [Aphelenchoides avenae]|nr:Protein F26A10.2 [Aphelenchus avenae]
MIKAENYEADFLAGFDLDEMNALEDGDLSLFNTLDNAPSYGLSDSFSGPSEFIPPPDGAFAEQKSTFKPPSSNESLGSDLAGIQRAERPKKAAAAMSIQKLEEPPMGLQEEDESELHEEPLQQQHMPPSRTAETPEPGLFPAALHLHNGQVLPPGIDPNEPMLPPLVIDPMEVGKISVILQKNQCCECKACGKLFKSIWYLKQHSVRHSNERPFRCNFCGKQFKFRSNLYQHRCPGRTRHMDGSLCKCPDKNLCPHKATQGERGGRQNS